MYGSQNLPPGRSNDNSALGGFSKKAYHTASKGGDDNEDINIQEFIGNKINLRRSIE